MAEPILRLARPGDIDALSDLIDRSARALLLKDYSAAEIEGCLLDGVYGVDQQLVADKTFYCIEEAGRLIACGGWSYRSTLFGGDGKAGRDSTLLDPETQAAKIRAFFVEPSVVGGGFGIDILEASEDAARQAGFRRAVLLGTLTGSRFYARHGYRPTGEETIALSNGKSADYIAMEKQL